LCKRTFVIKLLAECQALTIVPLGLLLLMQRGGHVTQAIARIPTHAALRLPSGSPAADRSGTLAYSYQHNR